MSDGKIFKNQDYLQIKAYLNIDLSDADTVLLKYSDPNGVTGSWTATIEDEDNGIISRTFVAGTPLDVSGEWTFWAYVTFDDGRVAPGEAFKQMIYDEGS